MEWQSYGDHPVVSLDSCAGVRFPIRSEANAEGVMRSNWFVGAAGFVLLAAGSAFSQVPLVQSMIPVSTAPGSKSFTLTVYGAGFKSTAVVNWNGSPRLTEVISSGEVTATINAADVAVGTTGSITVTNSGMGGGTSNVMFFPVTVKESSVGMWFDPDYVTYSGQSLSFVAGDFNGDGKLDLAWVDSNYILNAALGNGDGTFQAALSSGITFTPIATGDFNNDGKIDLLGVDGNSIVVALGNGDGTFTMKWSTGSSAQYPTAVAADFNRDGNLDLYIPGGSPDSAGFTIFLGNGDGTFTAGTTYGPSTAYRSAVVGDFNRDGIVDLAAVGYINGWETYIYLGNGDGTLQYLNSFAGAEVSPFAADMNNDGKLDLVWPGGVLLGNGDGTFVGAGGTWVGSIGGIGDFNGDGILDLLSSDGALYLQPGEGNGQFLPPFVFYPPVGAAAGGIGDFNGDGHLDAIASEDFYNGQLVLQIPVSLSPSPASLWYATQNVGTTSAAQVATLTNVGWYALKINKVNITGTNAGSFTETNLCGTRLAADAACTISVSFTPKKSGNLVATVNVYYGGLGSPQTISLLGTGLAPPTASLTPSSLTFPTQLVGTSSTEQTATLTNTGNQDVAVSSVAISGPFTETNNCASSLGVGGTCQIQVVFSPTAKGTASGTLTVTDNASASPQTVSLSGSSTVMSLSPVGVNFGDQKVGTKSAAAPATLMNTGTTAVSITLISFTGANAEDFSESNNCGKGLAPKASCTINVVFDPTATGARSAALSVTDNGGGSPQTTALSGTGT